MNYTTQPYTKSTKTQGAECQNCMHFLIHFAQSTTFKKDKNDLLLPFCIHNLLQRRTLRVPSAKRYVQITVAATNLINELFFVLVFIHMYTVSQFVHRTEVGRLYPLNFV